MRSEDGKPQSILKKAEPTIQKKNGMVVKKDDAIFRNWNVIAFDSSRPPLLTDSGIVVICSMPS